MANPNSTGFISDTGARLMDMNQFLKFLAGGINITSESMLNPNVSLGIPILEYESAQDNIIASATGGQAAATPLLAEVNRIATAANTVSPFSSVILPTTSPGGTSGNPGLSIMVINHGANPIQVFGTGVDQIDDQTATSGVTQIQNSVVFYLCATSGQWYSEGLATGYAGSNLQTLSTQDAITASTTQTITGAKPLTNMINRVSTANSNDAVGLPTSKQGVNVVIINDSGQTIQIFPAVGESSTTIDGGTGGSAVTMATGKRGTFYCNASLSWVSVAGTKST